MRTRIAIAALIFMMVQAVLFGVGAIGILGTPLSSSASVLLPIMIVATMLISIPLSWWLAPRLRARYWRDAPDNAADRVLAGLS